MSSAGGGTEPGLPAAGQGCDTVRDVLPTDLPSHGDDAGRSPHVELTVAASGRRRGTLRWAATARPPSGITPWRYCWHGLAARGWPLDADEERTFVRDLQRWFGTGDLPAPTRDAVTNVLMVLRCGADMAHIARLMPGVCPGEMVAAYQQLETLRAAAVDAWTALLAAPSVELVEQHRQAAGSLMPVPLQMLLGSGALDGDAPQAHAEHLELWAQRTRDAFAATARDAAEIQEALAWFAPPSAEGVELGRLLYDPQSPALWSDPYFLPTRVGELVPLRIAALLGEPVGRWR
jgi:hypothetical protein